MRKTSHSSLLYLLIILFSLLQPNSSRAEKHNFEIVSPRYAISGVAYDLHIQALTSDGKIDTTFTGYVRVEGLMQEIEGKTATVERLGPFQNGILLMEKAVFQKPGSKAFAVKEQDQLIPVRLRVIPGFFSLLPPILAILLALIFRQVLISLFAGIWLGATFLWDYNPFLGLLRLLDHYVIASFASPDHAPIILFSLTLGGMVGIISRSGGTQGIVQKLSSFANHPRGGQLAAWAMGVFIFFDDYANTLIVGNTMRPITDRVRISREKLSYIVDSTAAPVCSVAVISTWIGFELGLIQSAFHNLGIDRNVYLTFLQTIPYRFYCLLTILFVLLIGLMDRDFGPMLTAERRARKTGKVLRDGSMPLTDLSLGQITAPDGAPLRWFNAVIPILIVIFVTMTGLWYNGKETLVAQGFRNPSLKEIIGAADAFSVLMWSSFSGALSAGILAISQKILSLRETLDAWISGIKSMIFAMIILVFAWSIGKICEDLQTADYVVAVTRGLLSPHLLPLITFITAAFISFATGTSWGTMSILVPIVVPMTYKLTSSSSIPPQQAAVILIGTLASVLSGSVFGDHCSPISDTTIMSSMTSGADHVDHVRTQLPYALLAAIVAILVGYLPAGYGLSPIVSISLGVVLLTGLLFVLGKRVTQKS